MKTTLYLLIVTLLPALAYAKDSNWQPVIGEDPLSQQTVCLLVSAQKQINDGQSTTPINIVYNGKAFIAQTRSNIDLSYAGVGLQVDNSKVHPVDRLLKKTHAVFETGADEIRQQFIAGISGKLTLGFWPSWPKTTAVVTNFNLIGFTKAYQAFLHCQKNGELP